MSSATLTSPPIATARLVVDTDVASFIFKWHPEFAPRYVDIMRGSELIVSFMTLAEMRQDNAIHPALPRGMPTPRRQEAGKPPTSGCALIQDLSTTGWVKLS